MDKSKRFIFSTRQIKDEESENLLGISTSSTETINKGNKEDCQQAPRSNPFTLECFCLDKNGEILFVPC